MAPKGLNTCEMVNFNHQLQSLHEMHCQSWLMQLISKTKEMLTTSSAYAF
jgi:hypothetical protein